MTGSVESSESYAGLCPKAPGLHAAPMTFAEATEVHPGTPGGNSPVGRPGRIRDGISIALAGFRALLSDRQLLGFMSLAGLIMLFLVLVEGWNHRYIDPAFPAVFVVGGRSFSLSMQYLWVAIPIGQSHFIFYFGLFLLEAVCLFGFSVALAGIILRRTGSPGKDQISFRSCISGLRPSLAPLAILSLAMAFIATITSELTFNNLIFSGIIGSITQLFWLPWAYYEPHNWMLSALFYSATFISPSIMLINAVLLLAVLYLVPFIVIEKTGLSGAFAGSARFLKRTWRELLGCLIVSAVLILAIVSLGILVGQTPALLNHDYDFFISPSRGYLPMMVICYGLILAGWIMMAAGFATAGIAAADLYTLSETGQVPKSGVRDRSG